MRKNRFIVVVAIVTVLASSLIVLIQDANGNGSDASQRQLPTSATYVALPKNLLLAGDFSFGPLRNSQLSAVRITAPRAIQLAMRAAGLRTGKPTSSSRVTISLGSFVDKEAIITDWIGTKSKIPKAIPVYVVMISGLHIEGLGPRMSVNHEYDVLVNASSGAIFEQLTNR